MQAQMENMAKDLAKAEDHAHQLTKSLAKKNDECDQMAKQFQKEREQYEKQVAASKECLLELIASSKEDKKTFENDSKELRQHLATIQAELQKANQAPIDLERKLESRLIDILNAQSLNKEKEEQKQRQQAEEQRHRQQVEEQRQRQQAEEQRQQAHKPRSPRKYTHERQQPEKPVRSQKYTHKKGLSLDDFDEFMSETYQVQSRDDDDVLSLDSDIDMGALGNLSPEQQDALLNLDLSGNTAEVATQLKKIPGLTNNQVTLLLQVASSLAA
jgi:chromosome segregation ATPase